MSDKKHVGYRCTVTYSRKVICGWDIDIYKESENFDSCSIDLSKRAAKDFINKHRDFESYYNFKKEYFRLYEVLMPTIVEEEVNSEGLTEQEQENAYKEIRRQAYLKLKEEFGE